MALLTMGTTGQATLAAVSFSQDPATLLPADLQSIHYGILDDQNVAFPPAAISGIGGFVREGKLFVPNRGSLLILPGDFVALDTRNGWPILIRLSRRRP